MNEIDKELGRLGVQLKEIECLSHHLVGGNPADEQGSWATVEEAVLAFAEQFAKISLAAQGGFLFIHRAPVLQSDRQFEGGERHKMIGLFSVVRAKN
jgi:hypothetical protein